MALICWILSIWDKIWSTDQLWNFNLIEISLFLFVILGFIWTFCKYFKSVIRFKRPLKLKTNKTQISNGDIVTCTVLPKFGMRFEWMGIRPKPVIRKENKPIVTFDVKNVTNSRWTGKLKQTYVDDGDGGKEIHAKDRITWTPGEPVDIQIKVTASQPWKGKISIQIPTTKGYGFARKQLSVMSSTVDK